MKTKKPLMWKGISVMLAVSFSLLPFTSTKADSSFDRRDAFETVELLRGDLNVAEGLTTSVAIQGYRHVENLIISAEAIGRPATVEVLANGQVKGTLYLPGVDPSYVVTIREATGSIELRNVGGGTARFHQIKSVQAKEGVVICPGCTLRRTPNQLAALASKGIELTESLEGYADYSDFGKFLLPVKLASGKAYAAAVSRDCSSQVVRERMLAVVAEIKFAQPYIEHLMQQPNAFELAVEMLALKERISEVLN